LAPAGFPPDTGGHGFTPHLSLVRRVPLAGAVSAVFPLAALTMPAWSCHSFVLVRSQGSSLGSDYGYSRHTCKNRT